MIPLDSKARDCAQQIRLFAMIGKMLDRLFDQEGRLLPRAFLPKQ
jgi:hypothetical protein